MRRMIKEKVKKMNDKGEEFMNIPKKIREWLTDVAKIKDVDKKHHRRDVYGDLKVSSFDIPDYLRDPNIHLFKEKIVVEFKYYQTTYYLVVNL